MKTLLGSNRRKVEHPRMDTGAVLMADCPTHEEIAGLAYRLYEQRGCPQGCDLEFWLAAERQLLSHG